MPKPARRRTPPASRPDSARRSTRSTKRPIYTARQRELTTKRRGELAELAFTLKAASLGFGVAKPFGDSERYDALVDARQISPRRGCPPACPTLRKIGNRDTGLRGGRTAGTTKHRTETDCPALHHFRTPIKRLPWCPPHPWQPIWRVQVKCSTQLLDDLYRLNAHRRTRGRAVPYLPGEIDFLAAYIIPEDTWYIIPLEGFLGSTSLLFRRRGDSKPGRYDAFREAWRLLRPKR